MNHRYRIFYIVYRSLLKLAHEIESDKGQHFDPVGKCRLTILETFIHCSNMTNLEILEDLERINKSLTGTSIIPEDLIESAKQDGSKQSL